MSAAPGSSRSHGLSSDVTLAALAYFACVFGCGFVLGIVRTLWAEPRFGERVAELIEAPLMLIAIVFSARWTVGRFHLLTLSSRAATGVSALLLLLFAEVFVVLSVRGIGLAEYVEGRDPVAGLVYVAMLGVFSAMPALTRPRGHERGTSRSPGHPPSSQTPK